jgi:hypothetical protein
VKLTNNSAGPKAVTTVDRGVVILQKGEEADLDVSEENLAAYDKVGLLDASDAPNGPSMADIHREIASAPIGKNEPGLAPAAAGAGGAAGGPDGGDGGDGADDPAAQVQKLVDGNSKDELVELAKRENVDAEGTKQELAARIVEARGKETGGEQ